MQTLPPATEEFDDERAAIIRRVMQRRYAVPNATRSRERADCAIIGPDA